MDCNIYFTFSINAKQCTNSCVTLNKTTSLQPLILSTQNLSKHYGDFKAVNHINLEVYQGDIFGFLGPNGAGKSTTMRMLLSLIQATEGNITWFGQSLSTHRSEILSKIGCIVEKPDFYPYLTGLKNLQILASISGKAVAKTRIDEVIELVGLAGRENDKVKTYSQGMKQRLGIAQALLHDPEVIILDEPTNGLDPQGIIDVRNLILSLKHDMGKTVILSSHILYEVELLANRMVIINKGEVVVQGEVAQLLAEQELKLEIETNDNEIAAKLLSAYNSTLVAGDIKLRCQKDEVPIINKLLIDNGLQVYSLKYTKKLEEAFLSLTN